MSESQNTVVCSLDPKSPRISAFDIHEWIYEQLHVPENAVNMVQIDGPRRQVYIKFADFKHLQEVLHSTNGPSEYKQDNGEISLVNIEMGAMGTRRVRIANQSLDIPDGIVRLALATCVEIKEIQENKWSRAYRYSVANDIRIVVIILTKYVPSHMTITGNSVSII